MHLPRLCLRTRLIAGAALGMLVGIVPPLVERLRGRTPAADGLKPELVAEGVQFSILIGLVLGSVAMIGIVLFGMARETSRRR